jgi:hypothetical protein
MSILYGFHSVVGCVEESTVNAFAPEAAVGIDFTKEENSFTLFRDFAQLFELALKKPEVFNGDGLANGNRSDNKVDK